MKLSNSINATLIISNQKKNLKLQKYLDVLNIDNFLHQTVQSLLSFLICMKIQRVT